jgi:hypothetical protein
MPLLTAWGPAREFIWLRDRLASLWAATSLPQAPSAQTGISNSMVHTRRCGVILEFWHS